MLCIIDRQAAGDGVIVELVDLGFDEGFEARAVETAEPHAVLESRKFDCKTPAERFFTQLKSCWSYANTCRWCGVLTCNDEPLEVYDSPWSEEPHDYYFCSYECWTAATAQSKYVYYKKCVQCDRVIYSKRDNFPPLTLYFTEDGVCLKCHEEA